MTSFLTLFVGLLATGMPVFLVLGLCAGAMFMTSGQPLVGAAQLVINELNSPTLMALPLFVMAATFMRFGGVAKALVNLAAAWLGGLPGSLGLVTVVACTLFAAIFGSSVATALAMGTILIPAMIERGYPRSFALGVVGASGTIGIVIPPSLPLILYGIVAEQSVPRLFLAGILPGLLQATAFFIWVLYEARRRKFPVEPVLPFRERMRVTLTALPALLVPFVVMVGIYGGFVTVTEAAALSAVVALGVSLLFYRGFHWTETLSVVANGLRSAASIMLIIATALAVGHWLTESGAPARFVEFLLNHQFSTWQFLLAINALLLVLGCFLEVTATLLLVLPILAPALAPMGVDPVHFSIIFTHNMEIGLIHPPVGLNLFVLSSIAVAPMGEAIRGILPFLVILLIVLAIITYVPVLTLWLPGAVFGRLHSTLCGGIPRAMPCSWHRVIRSRPHFSGKTRSNLRSSAGPPSSWDVAARGRGPSTSRVGCGDRSVQRKAARLIRRDDMLKKTGWVSAGLTVAALSTLVSVSLGAGSAEAAVAYCKTAGVPQGCVVRPVVPVVPVAAVAATGVHATSVRVTRVRVANVGRVGVGARGVGVRPGTPWNRGGPVNRVGRR